MLSEGMNTERRVAVRCRAFRAVRLHQPNPPHVVETLTTDLTTGGMRCVSPCSFPPDRDVQVELLLSDGAEPCVVTGRPVWALPLPGSSHIHLGVVFVDSSSRNKRRLSAYISKLPSK